MVTTTIQIPNHHCCKQTTPWPKFGFPNANPWLDFEIPIMNFRIFFQFLTIAKIPQIRVNCWLCMFWWMMEGVWYLKVWGYLAMSMCVWKEMLAQPSQIRPQLSNHHGQPKSAESHPYTTHPNNESHTEKAHPSSRLKPNRVAINFDWIPISRCCRRLNPNQLSSIEAQSSRHHLRLNTNQSLLLKDLMVHVCVCIYID